MFPSTGRDRRSGPGIAAVLLVAVLTSGTAVASEPGQETVKGLSAVDLFNAADRARADGRNDEAIAFYNALTKDPDTEVRAEARFRLGMLLSELDRNVDAAVVFRALLDEKPDAARVRLELARVLAAMGDEAGARRSLRQAQRAGLPQDVALVVNQFSNALRSPQRFGGSMELALAPDSNINRATAARTLDTIIAPLTLSDDARARSGIGLKVGGQVFARAPISPKLTLLPRVSTNGNLYKASQFNDVSASALVGLQWQGARDRITPSLGLTRRWYGKQLYARTQAVNVDWIRAVGRSTQVSASGSVSRARYVANALQDGTIFNLNLAAERALTARVGVGASLTATRQTARDPGYALYAGGLSLSGWREVGSATLFASVGGHRTLGDARLFLFPERRRDWLYHASVGATFRRLTIKSFAPVVRVSWERNSSTVGLYDYRRISTNFGITRAF